MKLFSYDDGSSPRVGVFDGASPADGFVDLTVADPSLPLQLKQIIAIGRVGLEQVGHALIHGTRLTPSASFRLLPPIPDPEKIICIGLNYVDHARETGAAIPAEPVVFNKVPTTLLEPEGTIQLPTISERVDYEAELVVVIGSVCRNVVHQDALAHVAGYCCGNDISARDWQKGKPAGQWFLGKTFDTFAPIGPWLVTPDEVGNPGNLAIRLRMDGQIMQDSNTDQLIFPIAELIAYVSQVMTLRPGDLLFTGTPAGVGDSRRPPVYLRSGMELEVEIERIGTLRNRVG